MKFQADYLPPPQISLSQALDKTKKMQMLHSALGFHPKRIIQKPNVLFQLSCTFKLTNYLNESIIECELSLLMLETVVSLKQTKKEEVSFLWCLQLH